MPIFEPNVGRIRSEIYNAFVNHSLLVSQSTDNIDKRQQNFLNYNIIKEIDYFGTNNE